MWREIKDPLGADLDHGRRIVSSNLPAIFDLFYLRRGIPAQVACAIQIAELEKPMLLFNFAVIGTHPDAIVALDPGREPGQHFVYRIFGEWVCGAECRELTEIFATHAHLL